MYQYAIHKLSSAGYIQYEISNFARSGKECRHNINYWKNGEYYGFGAGAHSYINGCRYWNIRSVDGYISKVESNQSPIVGEERLKGKKKMAESTMLSLRLSEGIDRNRFQSQFHLDPQEVFPDIFTQYAKAGLLQMDENHIRLTQKGFYLSDTIFADLFE